MANVNASEIDKFIANFYDQNPFARLMEMEILELFDGKARLRLHVRKELTNVYEIAHGGALMSLGDMAMGAACLTCGKKVVTLEYSMNFIHAAAVGKSVQAVGNVIHNGSKTMVAECDILDEEGQLLGRAHGTFFVIGSL